MSHNLEISVGPSERRRFDLVGRIRPQLRIYLIDTGTNVGSADGNRLIRFTKNYIEGDLEYEVITDLENASVGDIDDMSPGLVKGEISDDTGFAMDSSVLSGRSTTAQAPALSSPRPTAPGVSTPSAARSSTTSCRGSIS